MEYLITANKNKSSDFIKFNLEDLIDASQLIIDKYKFKDETDIQMFNRFAVQLIEEVYEYGEYEYNITPSMTSEKINEFVDMILYTGSIMASFRERMHAIGDESLDFNKELIINKPLRESNLDTYSMFHQPTIELVGKIRRLYPDRKYHKLTPPATDIDERIEVYKDVIRLLESYLIEILSTSWTMYEESFKGMYDFKEVFVSFLNSSMLLKYDKNLGLNEFPLGKN